jgi:N-acetylornithine carbamoyltransferase
MSSNFKGKNLFTCQEWTIEELETVFELSRDLKIRFKTGNEQELLKNKTLFMFFFATSTRTRNSFEAAMTQLGGHAHYLSPRTMRLGDPGAPEAIKDTVKVLERYGHAIAVRVYFPNYGEGEKVIREYAKWASIPVISMESDVYHPCQALADMLTIKEKIPKYEGKKYVQAWGYSPDALRVAAVPQSNVLMMTRYGMDVVYARPPEFTLDPMIIKQAKINANEYGGTFTETDNLEEALDGAQVVYMRNHASLNRSVHGDQKELEIINKYDNWTLTKSLMDLTNKKSIFMHCLPADREHEVTSEIMDGPHSVVFDEAENRLHVQKAVLSLVI